MKVLVTGGAGFIGSHVVEHFQGKAEVIVLDNFRSGHRRNLAGLQNTLIEGSILDRAKLDEAMRGVDQVYHLAAMISVPESMLKPRECVDLNATGTLHVLEAAEAAKVRKVVLASSAAVYGDNPTVPKVETMLPEPKSPYAVTKLDGEYYLELFRRERGLATTSLRFFNVFGPRQDPKSPYAAAVPIFIEKAVRGEPIGIFGDGEQTRDFIYVKDIVGALTFAAADSSMGGVFNVGYGRKMTVKSLAEEVISLTGSPSVIEHKPERPGDIKHSMASSDKLQQAGWRPRHSVAEGLAATVAYFKSLKA
ncbi:MAG: dTDP-glucose 4,6-dehydratase [Opitutia bacterium Tous-C2FEB]|nr:MAG: dTDP-glucose 4,6-dehydratase [Opitutae bacterium Tous-C2FEB]